MELRRRRDALPILAGMEELATATPSPVLHTQLWYARAVLATDENGERLFVEGLLRSALSTLELIGATAWSAQARAELVAAGERSSAVVGSSSSGRLSAPDIACPT